MTSKLSVDVELITPEKAANYLQRNTNNRPLRKSLVALLAREMQLGRWKLTHQGIAFNCNGTLLDGQHRLAAVVESGTAVRMLVTHGVATEDQLVMDDHAKRSLGDAASIIMGAEVSKDDAATLRCAVESQQAMNRGKVRYRITKLDFVDLWPLLESGIAFARIGKYEVAVTSAPIRAAFALAYYYEPDLERLIRTKNVVEGREFPDHDDMAAVTLRELCLKLQKIGGASSRISLGKKAQRAIKACCDRERISKLYEPAEWVYKFPLDDRRVVRR